MVALIPFRAEHLRAIVPQASQRAMVASADLNALGTAAEQGRSASIIGADGRLLLCGGVQPVGDGVGWLWSVLSDGIGSDMVALTRIVRRWIVALGLRRVMMDVANVTDARWARLLGFAEEGVMRSWYAAGCDARLFAAVFDGEIGQ